VRVTRELYGLLIAVLRRENLACRDVRRTRSSTGANRRKSQAASGGNEMPDLTR
jgi:hypothetical protein